ncbi:MAG: START domain-containing protein [Planctomycetota bacterium]|nr:START domain-containing protein [Planctomycetota bacterium]
MNHSLLKVLALTLLVFAGPGEALAQNRWQKINEESGVSVYSKAFPGTEIIGFRGIVDVDAAPRKVLHVFVENKHKHEWVNGLTKSVVLESVSKHESVVYQSFAMSSVVSDRDFVFRGKVTRNPKTGWISLKTRSERHPKAPPTVGVRGLILRSNITLIPISGGRKTRIILETLGDPKGWIPTWLVNKTQKNWPLETLRNLKTQVKKPYYHLYPLPKSGTKSVATSKRRKVAGVSKSQ